MARAAAASQHAAAAAADKSREAVEVLEAKLRQGHFLYSQPVIFVHSGPALSCTCSTRTALQILSPHYLVYFTPVCTSAGERALRGSREACK